VQHEKRVYVAHGRLYVPRNEKLKREDTLMKRLSTLAAGLLLGAAALQYSNVASSQDGWVTLLDSSKKGDWTEVGKANWEMKDGALSADKLAGKDLSYLVSKDSYKDFQIKAEFWTDEEANSGIFIRCDQRDKIDSKICYEVNIFDKRPDPSYGTGAIVDVAKVEPMPKAAGKWNTYEITAQGSHLVVVLNGQKTVDVQDSKHNAGGPFALQYGSGVVKFRKVQIKAL
jgi:3-keto-disaccharide hydrolase